VVGFFSIGKRAANGKKNSTHHRKRGTEKRLVRRALEKGAKQGKGTQQETWE